MFLRVDDHHMQLYPMVANHHSNNAKFVIYRSSLMTTMTTMNLQAIAASDYHDNHDHSLWLLLSPWVSTFCTRNTGNDHHHDCRPGDDRLLWDDCYWYFLISDFCKNCQFVPFSWKSTCLWSERSGVALQLACLCLLGVTSDPSRSHTSN